jgi:nucleotide-binding universal stress UspA family protein
MKTIVVGYDGSEAARRALGRAADLATAFASRLVVTSVAEPVAELVPTVDPAPTFGRLAVPGAPVDTSEIHRGDLEHARALLNERELEASFVLGRGFAADAIVDIAEQEGADLIVVGTREPGFLDRLLGGSVSEGVARSAHCDVLIVH